MTDSPAETLEVPPSPADRVPIVAAVEKVSVTERAIQLNPISLAVIFQFLAGPKLVNICMYWLCPLIPEDPVSVRHGR